MHIVNIFLKSFFITRKKCYNCRLKIIKVTLDVNFKQTYPLEQSRLYVMYIYNKEVSTLNMGKIRKPVPFLLKEISSQLLWVCVPIYAKLICNTFYHTSMKAMYFPSQGVPTYHFQCLQCQALLSNFGIPCPTLLTRCSIVFKFESLKADSFLLTHRNYWSQHS